MVRKKVKEPKVDSELLYAYARTNNLSEIDAFLHTSHQANLQQVGDRWAGVCWRKLQADQSRGTGRSRTKPCVSMPRCT